MLTQRRLIPHLPLMSRANHSNLVWSLKHPTLAVKKARVTKVVSPPTDDKPTDDKPPKLLSKYPKRFTRKAQINSNDSHQLYLVNDETATKIAQHLTKSVGLSKTFVETNPGEGKLTKLLVESGMTDLRLFEAFPDFIPSLQETYAQVHPNRVKLKYFDMVTLRRSIYLDRVTGGSRCADVLSELPFTEWEADDTNFAMYAATGSNTFYWHLIYSLVLQNSLLTRGRCELYMVSPSQTYMSLTSSNRSALSDYRALSILFQIFFEYQLLDKFPREHFVPSITNTRRKIIEMSDRTMRNVRGPQSTTIDPDSMYFVKIVPRRDLYDWCPPQQIQELWHFISMHFYNRHNRIIPMLEKLIPGIGARLILNFCTKQPERPQRTYKVDVIEAPPTTNPSMTISDRDYYENLSIYTHFGDLQPMQLFTLFQEFRRMPEFSSGVFLSTMERELQRKLVIKSELGDSISALRVKQTSGVDSKVDEKSVAK